MPTVSLDAINNGDAADATPVNNNFQEIQTAVNNIDANNFATGKILAPSKLTQEAATSGQALVWNGTIWAPALYLPANLSGAGATTGMVIKYGASAWAPGVVSECLGVVQYNPTTVTAAMTTSTTGADVDATNLSLTVTLPGTKMLVFQTASITTAERASETLWGIRESTTDVFYAMVGASAAYGAGRNATWYLITGLTAGAHTYKWAFKVPTVGTNNAECEYGTAATPAIGNPGPAVMALYAVS